MGQRLAPETEREIVEMYVAGESGLKIARELRIDQTTVYHVLDRHGVERRRPGARSTLDYVEIARRYKEVVMEGGGNPAEVRKEFGLNYIQLQNIIKAVGLPTNREIKANFRDERDKLAVELYVVEKWKIIAICSELQISMPQLYQILEKAGVTTRRKKENEDIKERINRIRDVRAQLVAEGTPPTEANVLNRLRALRDESQSGTLGDQVRSSEVDESGNVPSSDQPGEPGNDLTVPE